jgi:hypothetical protein
MAITQAVANSFKQELLEGEHMIFNTLLVAILFKLALYVSTATLNFCYYSLSRR